MKSALRISILVLLSLASLVACGGSSGDSNNDHERQPELISVDPEANDSSVLVGSPITATFDKTMNSGSAGTFVVHGSQTGKLTGTYTGGGSDTLRFDPDNGFKKGEEIEVILTTSLTSTEDPPLELPIPMVYRFRAEALGGTGVFNLGDTIAGQLGARGLAAGDWDGDLDLDLAVANFTANSVVALENDGTGSFTADLPFGGQFGASAVVALDWDGDGDLDLAVANSTGGNSVGILKNEKRRYRRLQFCRYNC